MKITAVGLLKHNGTERDPTILGLACDLTTFGFFQRNSVKEFLTFTSRMIVQRTVSGQRQTVQHEGYYVHVHVRDTGIAGIVFTDQDYPNIAAFSILSKVFEEFLAEAGDSWQNVEEDCSVALKVLDPALVKYQDPAQADKLIKIQKDLDDTKIILHQTLESVLRRGEKLDTLVEKSQDLSMASQMFYKQAKKANACCKYG